MSLTRSETVRAKWRELVFTDAAITAISPVYIEHDLGAESMHEVAKLRYNQKINFWAFTVTRSLEVLKSREYRVRYLTEVAYTKWADPDGQAYNDVLDAIEVLQEVVIANLGVTWDGVVAQGLPQTGNPSVGVTTIKGELAFTAQFNYEALICSQI